MVGGGLVDTKVCTVLVPPKSLKMSKVIAMPTSLLSQAKLIKRPS